MVKASPSSGVVEILWDLPFLRADGRPWFSRDDAAALVRQFVEREPGLSVVGRLDVADHWADVSGSTRPPDHVGVAVIEVVRRCVEEGSVTGEPPTFEMVLSRMAPAAGSGVGPADRRIASRPRRSRPRSC